MKIQVDIVFDCNTADTTKSWSDDALWYINIMCIMIVTIVWINYCCIEHKNMNTWMYTWMYTWMQV